MSNPFQTQKYKKAKEKALMQHGIEMLVYESGFSSLAEMRKAYSQFKKNDGKLISSKARKVIQKAVREDKI